jgi:CheY-like chemotaxis protein
MRRILIIDSQELFRGSLAALFEKAGFSVAVASTIKQAAAELIEHGTDLVLIDPDLPIPQGLALIQQMRQHPKHGATPVIILTSVAEKNCILRAKSLGAREYLLKQVLSPEK